MAGISITSKGSFDRTREKVRRMSTGEIFRVLSPYGAQGVAALSAATPRDSGETAGAWSFTITQNGGYPGIKWSNSHRENGFAVAIGLQYGHGTGTGGYVQGIDYINPAIQPIFQKMLDAIRKELSR